MRSRSWPRDCRGKADVDAAVAVSRIEIVAPTMAGTGLAAIIREESLN